MTFKSKVAGLLRGCPPIFQFASKAYHRLHGSFRTLSPGAPIAIRKSYEYLLERDGKVSGDYYEFGLFRGYCLLQSWKYCKELNLDEVNFYGFDSFEGLPPAEGIDQADGRFFGGQFSCSRQEVEKNLAGEGLDMQSVHLVEGFFEDSLTPELHAQYPFKTAAVVLLDCDYYSSTKTALEWMDRYIKVGTILLFDDWFSFGDSDDLGQPKALQEFLQRHPEYHAEPLWEFDSNGKGFVLNAAN